MYHGRRVYDYHYHTAQNHHLTIILPDSHPCVQNVGLVGKGQENRNGTGRHGYRTVGCRCDLCD